MNEGMSWDWRGLLLAYFGRRPQKIDITKNFKSQHMKLGLHCICMWLVCNAEKLIFQGQVRIWQCSLVNNYGYVGACSKWTTLKIGQQAALNIQLVHTNLHLIPKHLQLHQNCCETQMAQIHIYFII